MVRTALPPAVNVYVSTHIPLSVLAQMPEQLRVLGEAIRHSSEAMSEGYITSVKAYGLAVSAYVDANNTLNGIFDALVELELENSEPLKDVFSALRSARRLMGAIHKICGNFQDSRRFMVAFASQATVDATVGALTNCGNEIRLSVGKFGY
ncbi:MAG: hypothetical protein C0465_25880 [Ralstonia sp.]|uniref:hypothetical protein n=1 Tax=Ralstonia sp. TaxID=54061 RepID=UPI000D279FAC|nr:hypothetical protein [Ralstonia sp.]MBA4234006.1 hypothetical protein [Ralstonia sp.]PPD32345.1 MAG: hypothetical protein CTY21_11520 [Methylomonas sp.]